MTAKNKQQHTLEKRICIVLLFACIGLFASYVYFISASIVHVVIRTEVNQEVQKRSSEISLLEGRFIEAQHKVSSDIASLQGYTQTSHKVFIDRTAPTLVLSDGGGR
ncbi:MAG: hypothetical protein ACI9H6_000841 [Patiriisocius sp.]|jgi:hypothetical protein